MVIVSLHYKRIVTKTVCGQEHIPHLEVRGQLAEVNSLLLPRGLQGYNSDHQTKQTVHLNDELIH